MRYIDNGIGDPRDDALFPWLETMLTADVVGIRWQSGFFETSVLGVFIPLFQRLAKEHLDTIVLIGSNDGETVSSAVHKLVEVLGLPRPNALLGVVSYADGFYHPKTIHLRYSSGRQVAYVGSANMTARGINGLNIEAGILFDSDEGDPIESLTSISSASRAWFDQQPKGLFTLRSHDDVIELERRQILTTEHTPRPGHGGHGNRGGAALPRRSLRHVLPPWPERRQKQIEQPPDLNGDVLIAELAGPGRWGQAAFPQWFIDNFFQVLPGTGEVLRLIPVTQADGVGHAERRPCGHKEGSRNWYFELGLASELGVYPQQAPKPIGVFHRIEYQTFRYTILMPDDESYPPVAQYLAANRDRLNRRRSELARAIVPAVDLRAAWPDAWFFDM